MIRSADAAEDRHAPFSLNGAWRGKSQSEFRGDMIYSEPKLMVCSKCGRTNPDDAPHCENCGAPFAEEAATVVMPTAATSAWHTTAAGSEGYTAPPEFRPGLLVGGRYEILALLGEGGMGAVYKARDCELERYVALKVIRPELAGHPETLRRFKQELILARKVSHKNVIRIFDLGAAEGVKFISMDFIEGADLASRLRQKGKLPATEAVPIISQVCRALEAAHAEGVVHRDLKPQNIMIDADGKVTVMDFGIARSADAAGMTRTGVLIGTPAYMSPEQAQGQHVDARSDLFALGIIFYELVTGVLPFAADSPMAMLFKRVQEKPRPPIELEPELPFPVNNIVLKCLAADLGERYQSAREMLADLEDWQASLPGAAPFPPRLLRKRRVHLWRWIAATLILLQLVAGVFIYRRYRASPAPATHKMVTLLVADFNNSTADPVFDGTLETSLRPALENASFISVYDAADARRAATQVRAGARNLDEGLARLVAVRQGISAVVSGSIALRKPGYLLSVRAMDSVTGNVLASKELPVAGKDGVLPALGKLATTVRKALGDNTPESAQLAAAETFTAGSLPAAHAYAMGQEFSTKGEWEQALEHYQRATQLEPDLGRAYAGTAVAYANLSLRQEADKAYQLAMARLYRMTEREKFRTRGGYYLMVRNHQKAVEEFTALVSQFPSDSAGLNDLALAHFYGRQMPRALADGRRALQVYPNSVLKMINVGLYAMYAGDFQAAERTLKKVLEKNPTYAKAMLALGLSQLAAGRPGEADESYRLLAGFPGRGPSFAALGQADLAVVQGRAGDAIRILERSVEAEIASKHMSGAADHLAMLAGACVMGRRPTQAVAAGERAVAAGTQEAVWYQAARVYIECGQEAKALKLAAGLAGRLEPDSRAYAKLIEGEMRLRHADPMQAIDKFQEGQRSADTWLGRLLLGRAYVEAGKFTEASSELELCLKRRGEATAAFLDDMPTWRWFPAVYYYLGRAQQGLKNPEAKESYRAFLGIKAGNEDALVADARQRLAGL